MGGKKSAPTIGYWYKLAIHFLIGKAIDVLLEIRGGDKTAWTGFQDESGDIAIAAKNLWGGEKAEGGIEGAFELMMGDGAQMPNAYLGTVFGAKNPAYRGKATGVFKGGLYGAFTPYPKGLSFKVRRIFDDWPDEACWYPETAAIPYGIVDEAAYLLAADATGWESKSIAYHATPGYSNLTVPTSGYTTVQAPFGSPGAGPPTGLPVANSNWTIKTILWARKTVSLPDDTYTIKLYAENGACVFVDGVFVGACNRNNVDLTGWGGEQVKSFVYSGAIGEIAIKCFDETNGAGKTYAAVEIVGVSPGPRAMNPAHMLYESIVSSWGTGEPAEIINEASFLAAADRLFSEGFGLCTKFDPRHQTVEQFQRRIEQIIDGRLSQSRIDGQYYLILIRDDYNLDDLPILTDDDILEFRQEDSDPLESVNQVMVEWFDPEKKEKRITPPVNALGAIRASGSIISETGQYPEIPYEDLALRVADRDVAYKSRPAKRFSLTTNRTPYNWLGGQLFRLQAPRRGIEDMVCLLGELGAGVPRSGSMRIKASQHVAAMRSTVYVTGEPGVDHTPSPTPVATATQRLLEAPYTELAERVSAADRALLASDAGFALSVAQRPSGGLDYTLYTGAGSEDLVEAGSSDFCPTALVVEAADRYERNFTMSGASDLDEVLVGSLAVWGDELVRVDAIDATALTLELGRGCGDTVGQEHAAGERIWFLDGNCGTDTREYSDGEVVHAKLLTRTSSAELALADATEVTTTMNSRAARPYPPALLLVDGLQPGAAVTETFTVSWSNRDRLLQADQLVDQEAASVGPEDNTSFTVCAIDDATDAVILELTGLGGSSVDILLAADCAALRIEAFAVRDGLASWQTNSTPAFAYTRGAAGAAYAGANPGSPGQGTGTAATTVPADYFAVATGADTLAATFDPAPMLTDGLELKVRAAAANTGAATFNANGSGAIALTKLGGTALVAGDIAAAGHELTLRYRAGVPRWELLNPAAASGSGNVATDTHAASWKTSPAAADEFPLIDSAASYALKKLTWSDIKASLWSAWGSLINGGTAKSTPANADALAIMDSAASNATKKLTFTDLKAFLKSYFDTIYATVAGSGTWVPLGSVVVSGGAVTSVEVTGFNGALYSALAIEFTFKNPLGSGNTLSLYCAYDGGAIGATATDYYRQSVNGDGSLSGARANSGQFGSMGTGAAAYIAGEAKVWQGRDGCMKGMVQSNSNQASLTIFRHYCVSRVTAGTDITGLRITGSANGIDNGSEFHVYGIVK